MLSQKSGEVNGNGALRGWSAEESHPVHRSAAAACWSVCCGRGDAGRGAERRFRNLGGKRDNPVDTPFSNPYNQAFVRRNHVVWSKQRFVPTLGGIRVPPPAAVANPWRGVNTRCQESESRTGSPLSGHCAVSRSAARKPGSSPISGSTLISRSPASAGSASAVLPSASCASSRSSSRRPGNRNRFREAT